MKGAKEGSRLILGAEGLGLGNNVRIMEIKWKLLYYGGKTGVIMEKKMETTILEG